MTNRRDLGYYMSLPHRVEVVPTEDGTGFTAAIPALKGCIAFGETVEEAYEMVAEVKEAWIEIALEEGWSIPEPEEEEVKRYSGRFNVRLPRYLHRKLAEAAETEDTSLNQLVVSLLSEGVERRRQRSRSTQFINFIVSPASGQTRSLERALTTWRHQEESSRRWPGMVAGMQLVENQVNDAINAMWSAQRDKEPTIGVWRRRASDQSISLPHMHETCLGTGEHDTAD